jgi:hypothetical protein
VVALWSTLRYPRSDDDIDPFVASALSVPSQSSLSIVVSHLADLFDNTKLL